MLARKKTAYHHGDLRRASIETALALIDARGPGAFSLREVARQIGVSHGSIYQHFSDKRELLAAVAEEGYRDLALRLRNAGRRERGVTLARVEAIARAYVRFAVERPSHFHVMTAPDLYSRRSPRLGGAEDEAYAVLRVAIAAAQEAGALRDGNTEDLALCVWTFAHGYAEACRSGRGVYSAASGRSTSTPAIDRHFAHLLRCLFAGLAGSPRP